MDTPQKKKLAFDSRALTATVSANLDRRSHQTGISQAAFHFFSGSSSPRKHGSKKRKLATPIRRDESGLAWTGASDDEVSSPSRPRISISSAPDTPDFREQQRAEGRTEVTPALGAQSRGPTSDPTGPWPDDTDPESQRKIRKKKKRKKKQRLADDSFSMNSDTTIGDPDESSLTSQGGERNGAGADIASSGRAVDSVCPSDHYVPAAAAAAESDSGVQSPQSPVIAGNTVDSSANTTAFGNQSPPAGQSVASVTESASSDTVASSQPVADGNYQPLAGRLKQKRQRRRRQRDASEPHEHRASSPEESAATTPSTARTAAAVAVGVGASPLKRKKSNLEVLAEMAASDDDAAVANGGVGASPLKRKKSNLKVLGEMAASDDDAAVANDGMHRLSGGGLGGGGNWDWSAPVHASGLVSESTAGGDSRPVDSGAPGRTKRAKPQRSNPAASAVAGDYGGSQALAAADGSTILDSQQSGEFTILVTKVPDSLDSDIIPATQDAVGEELSPGPPTIPDTPPQPKTKSAPRRSRKGRRSAKSAEVAADGDVAMDTGEGGVGLVVEAVIGSEVTLTLAGDSQRPAELSQSAVDGDPTAVSYQIRSTPRARAASPAHSSTPPPVATATSAGSPATEAIEDDDDDDQSWREAASVSLTPGRSLRNYGKKSNAPGSDIVTSSSRKLTPIKKTRRSSATAAAATAVSERAGSPATEAIEDDDDDQSWREAASVSLTPGQSLRNYGKKSTTPGSDIVTPSSRKLTPIKKTAATATAASATAESERVRGRTTATPRAAAATSDSESEQAQHDAGELSQPAASVAETSEPAAVSVTPATLQFRRKVAAVAKSRALASSTPAARVARQRKPPLSPKKTPKSAETVSDTDSSAAESEPQESPVPGPNRRPQAKPASAKKPKSASRPRRRSPVNLGEDSPALRLSQSQNSSAISEFDFGEPSDSETATPRANTAPKRRRSRTLPFAASSGSLADLEPPKAVSITPLFDPHTALKSNRWSTKLSKSAKDFEAARVPLRTGPWSAEEVRILEANVNDYLSEHDGCESVSELVFNSTKKERSGFYLHAAQNIRRPLYNVYSFVKRRYCAAEKTGRYSGAEEEELLALVAEHGPRWALIAAEMGRAPESLCSKYRLLRDRQRVDESGGVERGWPPEDVELLESVVRQLTGVAAGPVPGVQWEKVAERISSKTAAQCRLHWTLRLAGVGTSHHWSAGDELLFLQAVCDCDDIDGEIPWRRLQREHWPNVGVTTLKNLWYRMKSRVPNAAAMPLRELVQELLSVGS